MTELADLMLAIAGTLMGFIGFRTSTKKDSEVVWGIILVVNFIITLTQYFKLF